MPNMQKRYCAKCKKRTIWIEVVQDVAGKLPNKFIQQCQQCGTAHQQMIQR